ncbi:hypothetical protein K0U83_00085 [bacterium]|nr:hypothetical protein [bacterium]
MTNLSASIDEDVVAESEAPADEPASESIEAANEVTDEPAPVEPEPEYLDTAEVGDRHVKLMIDGEERSAPLNEVLQGYNSNAAATKRFQEASEMQKEAAQALNLAKAVSNNPGMTMQVLASQAGLTVEQFLNLTPQQQENVAASTEPEPEFTDPLERSLYEERQARMELERRFEEREQRFVQQEADRTLAQAVGDLQTRLGASEDDARAVVGQAYQMSQELGQYVGPEMFSMIYQAQQYQKSQVQSQAQADAQATEAAENVRRQTAAAQASNAVGTGSGAVGTAPASVVTPMNAEQAVAAALDQLGVT